MRERYSINRLIEALDYLVDERVGVIRVLEEIQREPGTPEFFHVYAEACNTGAFTPNNNFRYTGGASANRMRAVGKAIGEAVERYCGAIYNVEELPLHSYDSAPFPCVEPERFSLYSEDQYNSPGFSWVPFTRRTTVRWAGAFDPLTGESLHVPAAMVYIPYFYYLDSGDSPIVEPISTGLAAHLSPEEAALSAVCEAVERDAFSIAWQAKLAPPQIVIETLSDENYDLVKRFERVGAAVTLFNVTLDSGIPSVLSVLRTQGPSASAFVVAASSDPSPEKAIQNSLEELTHTRRYSQIIRDRVKGFDPGPNFENVKEQADHLNYWGDPKNSAGSAFLFKSKKRVEFDDLPNLSTGDPKRDVRALCEKIRETGHRTLLLDLTTEDVARCGFSTVRAVIPGYHPMFLGHAIRSLGGTRLWEVPQKLGYPGVTREGGDNPFPHPFP